ncbi:hypothetical protein WICPIJ_001974 [Wickerhamomyces pijperi]|uniref:Uncharacterized protein n=1 Tax=Wickerhamomyces pijperi TaxID=599730 RepID=A0A9P8QC95_WICPI|nr:hypothetical protein WICPIJ_001974 [Wickerhamomyces pijperi]
MPTVSQPPTTQLSESSSVDMTQTSAVNSILHQRLLSPFLRHSVTLNLILKHQLDTKYAEHPRSIDTVQLILQNLEKSNQIWFNPSPYRAHIFNVCELTAIDVLTLLHLPHEGPYRELCDHLISDLERFVVESIFMILRVFSLMEPHYAISSINFSDLDGLNEESFKLLTYFVVLNNPRLFALTKDPVTGQVIYHPNSEFVVGRLFQKMYHRRVVRIVYEKYHQVLNYTLSKRASITIEKALMKETKSKDFEEVPEMKSWDAAVFIKIFRDDNNQLFPQPVELLCRKSIIAKNRQLSATDDDPSLQTLKLMTKERQELLGMELLNSSSTVTSRISIQGQITIRELFISITKIFKLDRDGEFLDTFDRMDDINWNESIEKLHYVEPESLFVGRLGSVVVFAGQVLEGRKQATV